MEYKTEEPEEKIIFIPTENNELRSSSLTKHNKNSKSVVTSNNDYYEWMANAKEVRPITVTENVDLNSMSCSEKVLWSLGTVLQMLTLTVLSIRTDRLFDWDRYLKHHWKHYSGIINEYEFTQ